MEHFPALYFDTETSDYHERDKPALPVQIAAILATEDRVVTTLSCLIHQGKWKDIKLNPIAQRVIDIHGVTPVLAEAFGWSPDFVLNRLRQMLQSAKLVVAHNIKFDLTVIDNALKVQSLPPFDWGPEFCTMRESAEIVGIRSGGRYSINGFKAPKLSEAYYHWAKKELSGAHDALHDVYACRLIHRGIIRHREESNKSDSV